MGTNPQSGVGHSTLQTSRNWMPISDTRSEEEQRGLVRTIGNHLP